MKLLTNPIANKEVEGNYLLYFYAMDILYVSSYLRLLLRKLFLDYISSCFSYDAEMIVMIIYTYIHDSQNCCTRARSGIT